MLRLELGAMSKDKATGKYTVQVKCLRDSDGKLVGQKDFEAVSATSLKAQVKPIFEALVDAEQTRENIRSIAGGVLDEIMAEVVQ